MNIRLLSCTSPRPDQRAIAKLLEEFAIELDASSAYEAAEYLIDGEETTIEIDDKSSSSAIRALRKCEIDYELVD